MSPARMSRLEIDSFEMARYNYCGSIVRSGRGEIETMLNWISVGCCNEVCHNFDCGINWYRKSDSLCTDTYGDVDTDEISVDIQQRTTRVTGIDVCIGLYEIFVRLRSVDRNVAVKSAYDSNCYVILISEWIPIAITVSRARGQNCCRSGSLGDLVRLGI